MPGCAELLVVVPIVFVGWIARKVFRETGDTRTAWLLFVGAMFILIGNCAWGYLSFQALVAEKKWTAASFAIARTAFLNILGATAFWFASERIIRISKQKTPQDK